MKQYDVRMQPERWTRASVLITVAAALAAGLTELVYYFINPVRPTAMRLDSGWWRGADQGRYLRSTLAWAAGQLNPADHWYMPGYPLLAVPFIPLTHSNPYLWPDIAALVATICLTGALAGRLAPSWRLARPFGALAALAVTSQQAMMAVWVMPWTSTPEAPLALASLLSLLHVLTRPASWRAGFCVGFSTCAIAAFRPSDAALQGTIALLACSAAAAREWPGRPAALRTAAAALMGAVLAIAPTVVAYIAVNSWQLSEYLKLSTAIGFEWRLLPLRWVLLVLSPQPLFPLGDGLITTFPWLAMGLAGIAACLVKPPCGGSRLPHLVVSGAACAHSALYLCYRDLHPQGLWLYGNYHYFKWDLVVLTLYALLLLLAVLERSWRGLWAGVAALALLMPWRAELVRQGVLEMPHVEGAVLKLPSVSLGVQDAILIPASGNFQAIYGQQHNLFIGAEKRWYSSTSDFRITPQVGGLMLAPLRPLQAGTLLLEFGPGVTILPGEMFLARQQIVYGLPCWLPWRSSACAHIVLSARPAP